MELFVLICIVGIVVKYRQYKKDMKKLKDKGLCL